MCEISMLKYNSKVKKEYKVYINKAIFFNLIIKVLFFVIFVKTTFLFLIKIQFVY